MLIEEIIDFESRIPGPLVVHRVTPKKRAPSTLYVISLLFIHRLSLFYKAWQNQRP